MGCTRTRDIGTHEQFCFLRSSSDPLSWSCRHSESVRSHDLNLAFFPEISHTMRMQVNWDIIIRFRSAFGLALDFESDSLSSLCMPFKRAFCERIQDAQSAFNTGTLNPNAQARKHIHLMHLLIGIRIILFSIPGLVQNLVLRASPVSRKIGFFLWKRQHLGFYFSSRRKNALRSTGLDRFDV